MTDSGVTLGLVAIGTVLALAATLRRGTSIAAALGPALAYGVGLGFGLVSVVYFLSLASGAPRPGWITIGVAALLAAVGLSFAAKGLAPSVAPPPRREPVLAAVRVGFYVLLAMTVIAVVAALRGWDAHRPEGDWDAMAIWNVAARTMHRADGDLAALVGQLPSAQHPDYPLLVPASVAAQWSLVGSETFDVVRGQALAFLLALALLVHHAVRRLGHPALAPLAAALVLSTPHVPIIAQAQYADVPLAFFFLAATLGLATQLEADPGRRQPPALVGVCLGLLPWTKNEGIPLALILALGFLVFVAVRRAEGRSRFRVLLPLAAGAFLPLLALLVFKTSWAPTNDLVRDVDDVFRPYLRDADRWRAAGAGFLRELDPTSHDASTGHLHALPRWGVVWPFLAVALFCGANLARLRTAPRAFMALVALAASGAWFMVYVLTPRPLAWHIDTSLHRLLLQLFPTILVLAFALLGPPTDALRTAPRRRRRRQVAMDEMSTEAEESEPDGEGEPVTAT